VPKSTSTIEKKFFFASTNAGKINEATLFFGHFGIPVAVPSDFGINLDVDEPGDTLGANATIKRDAYLSALKEVNRGNREFMVMADDTGLFIKALDGEPGVRVRRWIGRKMSDREIIDYTRQRMRGIEPARREARFETVLHIGYLRQTGKIETVRTPYKGKLVGQILEEPEGQPIDGKPYAQLFYIPRWRLRLGEIETMTPREQLQYPTHRVQAMKSLVRTVQLFLKS
jgi:XTP/dITP diphosphohydrolase